MNELKNINLDKYYVVLVANNGNNSKHEINRVYFLTPFSALGALVRNLIVGIQYCYCKCTLTRKK